MSTLMTKEEAQAFKARWSLVNKQILDEVRQKSLEDKLDELADLYETAFELGWIERMQNAVDEVSARWQKLRRKLGGQQKTDS
jgi:hypothetical protein